MQFDRLDLVGGSFLPSRGLLSFGIRLYLNIYFLNYIILEFFTNINSVYISSCVEVDHIFLKDFFFYISILINLLYIYLSFF